MAAQTAAALVERVIDRDTIRVRMAGASYTVRLTGVDTPETKHPTLGVQPLGPEVSAYTTARLTRATVRLDLDPAGDAGDTCGRLLRYVMLGGENFNVSAPRTIAAAHIIPETGETFIAVSLYARWESPRPHTPTTWRVGYADAMVHRATSDLSTFIGYQDLATHRVGGRCRARPSIT